MNSDTDGDGLADAKAEVRRASRTARRARTPAEQADLGVGLLRVAAQAPALIEARGVTAYLALPGEPEVAGVRGWLSARGCKVWLPVVTTADDGSPALAWADDAHGLQLGATTPTGLRLMEPCGPTVERPEPVDVVLVPALAVDTSGARLGQGGGYYDRTVQRLGWHRGEGRRGNETRPLLVAVVHDDEVLAQVPAAAFDTRVDAVLTPSRWISCSSGRV